MNRRNLPPQAYTRETLAKAYEWLKSQPESLKGLATNADSLVTLYLQSRRSSSAAAPKSAQEFKNDLKNLAQGLKDFEEPEASAPLIPDVAPLLDLTASPKSTPTAPKKSVAPSPTPRTTTPTKSTSLDPHSQQILAEAKKRLNLSQDSEVLRMLLVLGIERLRQVLPPQN